MKTQPSGRSKARKYPDTILPDGKVVLSSYIDPVRQGQLGTLEEVDAAIADAFGPANDRQGVAGSGPVAAEVAAKNAETINENKDVAEVAPSAVHGEIIPYPGSPTDADLATLLEDVVRAIRRFVHLRLDRMYAEAYLLWIAGTHVFQWSDMFPRFLATSPEPGCGKSTLMKVGSFMCEDAVRTSSATPASLVRLIDSKKRTKGKIVIFADDAENFIKDRHTSLLNNGFDRLGGGVFVCEKDKTGNYTHKEFDVYAPLAMFRIGTTPVDSTRTRCIEIAVPKAKPGDSLERFDPTKAETELTMIKKALSRWATQHGKKLKGYDPVMPQELGNRDADLWRFLIAIADLAGGHWPNTARKTAVSITLNSPAQESTREFKAHIRDALALAKNQRELIAHNVSWETLMISLKSDGNLRVSSSGLCALMAKISAKYNNLNPQELAKRLRQFDISPVPIKIGDSSFRGYKEEELKDMLERYGPHGEVGEEGDRGVSGAA